MGLMKRGKKGFEDLRATRERRGRKDEDRKRFASGGCRFARGGCRWRHGNRVVHRVWIHGRRHRWLGRGEQARKTSSLECDRACRSPFVTNLPKICSHNKLVEKFYTPEPDRHQTCAARKCRESSLLPLTRHWLLSQRPTPIPKCPKDKPSAVEVIKSEW